MKHLLFLILSTIFFNMSNAQTKKLTPEEIVQAQTDAYNEHDLERFMSFFSPDIKIYNFRTGAMTENNFEDCYKTFKELFDLSPNLHSSTVKRITYNNILIVHVRIEGRKGSKEPLEIVFIAEVADQKIIKVTYIRPQ